jgi:hypothetical protein
MNEYCCDECPDSAFHEITKTKGQVTLNEGRIGSPTVKAYENAQQN